jgi:thiamine pyrophosphokinase
VVLCNGPPPPRPLLEYWLDGAELFVCADGAGYPYTGLPRPPDAVVGDFDSLSGRVLAGRDGPILLQSPDQETTDAEKALLYAIEQGAVEAILAGALGWRLDHTLINCGLLEKFAGQLRLCLAGEESDAVRIGPGDEVAWELPGETPFSVLPLLAPATGVSIGNARYELTDAVIRVGGLAAISNRVADPPLRIAVGGGSLLVTVGRQGWPAADE